MTVNDTAYNINLIVVTPEVEFKLAKNTAENPWELVQYRACHGRKRPPHEIENTEHREYFWIPLRPLAGRSNGNMLETKITEIEATSGLVRMHFEKFIRSRAAALQRGWWDLDPQRDYVLVEEHCDALDAQGAAVGSSRIAVEYETIAGTPVLKTARTYDQSSRNALQWTLRLESCKFGPPPAKIFELSAYGDFNPSNIKTITEPPAPIRVGIPAWIASGWMAAGLNDGFGFDAFRMCRPRRPVSPGIMKWSR